MNRYKSKLKHEMGRVELLRVPGIWPRNHCANICEKIFATDFCYFRSPISPWRGPQQDLGVCFSTSFTLQNLQLNALTYSALSPLISKLTTVSWRESFFGEIEHVNLNFENYPPNVSSISSDSWEFNHFQCVITIVVLLNSGYYWHEKFQIDFIDSLQYILQIGRASRPTKY